MKKWFWTITDIGGKRAARFASFDAAMNHLCQMLGEWKNVAIGKRAECFMQLQKGDYVLESNYEEE